MGPKVRTCVHGSRLFLVLGGQKYRETPQKSHYFKAAEKLQLQLQLLNRRSSDIKPTTHPAKRAMQLYQAVH